MLEYLKPVSKKHSISKVKASIILPQSIIRPDEIFNELKGNPNFAKYQKKALKRIKTIGINFQSDKFDNTIGEDIIDGFILEEYNDDGLLINFLTVQNEQNRASITFESKVYTTWNNFFSRFKEDLQHMSAIIKIYIQVINLIYIDEFIWMHQTDVPVRKIFNADSDLINKRFLDSANGSIILFSQNSEQNSEEKTEIAFSNRLKRVVINHQYVERLNSNPPSSLDELIANNIFDNKFNIAHDSNKIMLSNLLSPEVQQRIGLN